MAIVNGLTKERMLDIENSTVTSGAVDVNGRLQLTKRDGTKIDAGNVVGPTGASPVYPVGSFPGGTAHYSRLAILDGRSALAGADIEFILSGLGGYGTQRRATVVVHAAQRGDNNISVRAWGMGLEDSYMPLSLFTRQLGTYHFEVWGLYASYVFTQGMTVLARNNATVNIDSATTTKPANLVPVTLNRLATDIDINESRSWEGTVAPGWTFGRPQVTLSDGRVVSAYLPANDVDIVEGATVILSRTPGDIWTIIAVKNSEPKYLRQIPVAGQNGWTRYDSRQSSDIDSYSPVTVTKSSAGWVVAAGMFGGGNGALNTVVATLPVGFRPPYKMFFTAVASSPNVILQVFPNGVVTIIGSAIAGGGNWVTFGSIMFNVNLSYIPMSLVSPWVSPDQGAFGPASYAKDAYGIVSLSGVVNGGTLNTNAWTAPAGYTGMGASGSESHLLGTGYGGGIGYVVNAAVTGTTRPRVSPNGVVLSGIKYASAGNTLEWNTITSFMNGWGNYGGAFPTAQWALRPDGLVQLRGLIVGGGMGTIAFRLPAGVRPNQRLLLPSLSGDVLGRLDILYTGDVIPTIGSTSWFSIDNIMFNPQM